MDIIKFKNIHYSINSKLILKNINLNISHSGVTGIIGPSGSGKSTLLRIMNRLISPDSGSVYFNNKDFKEINPNLLRKQIGLVTQSPNLFEGTVKYNIKYGPEIWNEEINISEEAEILEKAGLDEEFLKRDVSTLSAGEQQRVNLARTLANKPKVILLDEPTSNLDIVSEEIIESTIDRLNKEGIKFIIVTHSLEQTKRITDNLVFIKEGEILEHTETKKYFKQNNPQSIKNYFKKTGDGL